MSEHAQRPRVPTAVQPIFEEIAAITDPFCHEHLDAEYAELCVKLAAKLARKRPSSLVRGDLRIWAAGIVYAVGRVNFLADPAQHPHRLPGQPPRRQGDIHDQQSRLIMDTLRIGLMDPEYSRQEMIDRNPMIWLLELNGLPVDARELPEEQCVERLDRSRRHPRRVGEQTTKASLIEPIIDALGWDIYDPDEVHRHPPARKPLAQRRSEAQRNQVKGSVIRRVELRPSST